MLLGFASLHQLYPDEQKSTVLKGGEDYRESVVLDQAQESTNNYRKCMHCYLFCAEFMIEISTPKLGTFATRRMR